MAVDEGQLFGAPLGELTSVGVTYYTHAEGRMSVTVHAHAQRTNKIATLRISSPDAQQWPVVCGAVTVFLTQANRMTETLFRRVAWAVHDRMGSLGYEVEIRNCGRPKKI